ncbi:type II restriction/modification system DNA methylase subunit YeeA [Oxalobacteraceae bacterium GrIS 2.11]
METTKLRRFAQYARRTLMELVAARLQLVLQPSSAARRENTEAIKRLEEAIKSHGEAQIIERVAYTWFNRFCALRFMDVNRYTRIGVVSPAEGQFQPEILAEAKMGHIDNETVPEKIRLQIFALLEGKSPSHDPQGEAYRLLVVAACNAFHRAMPFLFERIDDYTELLMPDDLLSGNSILAYTREAMTPDACEDVEVIGWLYQFYISEKKDAVFEGLKKNQKITPENIPAATQLFTPHWIVRYLVENSLGRLWMLNRPSSRLVEKMNYYIRPEQPETDFLKITNPEEIKICDPACGSGHMLTYAFDLLYAIYEEEGVDPGEIPEKILIHNLYGIEIDERAGELAAFALIMKARSKHRRFFNKSIKPNICVLENVIIDKDELTEYMQFIGRDLFTASLEITLRQFEEADNFGSLIRPNVTDVEDMLRILDSKDVTGHLFLNVTHLKVLKALQQAGYLSPKYHVVIANPPYMGNRNMNSRLGSWLKENYLTAKTDLFAIFIERNLELLRQRGLVAMITMQSWMFLWTYENLRSKILNDNVILCMAHLGSRAFDSIGGEVVSTTAFVIKHHKQSEFKGTYHRLTSGNSEVEKNNEFLTKRNVVYTASSVDFMKIPGHPLAYWASDKLRNSFESEFNVDRLSPPRIGMMTTDNERFLRQWYEISIENIGFNLENTQNAINSSYKWFPYNKGGGFRKWAGFQNLVVNWENGGQDIAKSGMTSFRGRDFYFKEGLTWSDISTGDFACRHTARGFIFDIKGTSAFPEKDKIGTIASTLNSRVGSYILNILNPTMSFQSGDIRRVPLPDDVLKKSEILSNAFLELTNISAADWNSNETSWAFTNMPLLIFNCHLQTLRDTYQNLRAQWQEAILKMQQLEEENNRIFIDAYGLQVELTPEVPLNEITLTCNPHYRYGSDKSEDEVEILLLGDTMRELVSYAVGCMFGRYSLDKLGLILANQGETLSDYLRQVPEPSFAPDDNNVIPMLNGDWFTDDIAERFREFMRMAFGEEHYEENLQFVEKALGKNGKHRDIRDYFLKDFYIDHVKRYKKRPIYWLFSSPKGTFNALIYLHRYRPDTVNVVLNRYLRDFREKLAAQLRYLQQVNVSTTASQVEKTRANKEIDTIKKQLQELDDYERDVLYPLATEQVPLNLDDGVKVNYLKLGLALKKIVGLDAKEED